jgi:histidinol-phosphate aminotransferase
MTQTLRPQPGILDIALYVGGDSRLAGHSDVLKLSSNENPHGPSPRAVEAFRAAAGDLHRYPSTDHRALREAIGEVHGLEPDRIICGVGSDEVLQMVAQAYAGPDDEVILTEHGFSMYPILAKMVGARPVTVPERERAVDVDAILSAVTERTRIVFIANPANPTGTMIGGNEFKRLAAGLPETALLVHDGAYA